MKTVGQVASLWRYPVKSMGGERVSSVYAARRGLRGDRRLAFSSASAPVGKPMLAGEERTVMLRCAARFVVPPATDDPVDPKTVEVSLPDGTLWRADDAALIPGLQSGLSRQNPMWLTQDNAPFMDCRPIALMSLATLEQLSREMGSTLAPRRFRENILFDLEAAGGFSEDAFVGHTLRIGDHVEIAITERDPRCRVITINPETGETMPELMKLVARDHQSRAGVYGIATVPGFISAGDAVTLLGR